MVEAVTLPPPGSQTAPVVILTQRVTFFDDKAACNQAGLFPRKPAREELWH